VRQEEKTHANNETLETSSPMAKNVITGKGKSESHSNPKRSALPLSHNTESQDDDQTE